MPIPPTLGTPSQSGAPRITHDPLSIEALLVWERMDTYLPNFVRPIYFDHHPGWVNPNDGTTLYSDYECVEFQEIDRQYLDVCYRILPGPIVSGSQVDKSSGIVTNYTKQLVKTGTVTSGVVGSVVVSLSIINGGTGFTGNGNLVFSGGGGSSAAGTFTFTAPSPAGKLASLTLTNAGAGFTSVPTVTITDSGGGTLATASATLAGTTIASLTLTNGGSGFTDVVTVTITDSGTGTGATGTAALTPTTIGSVVVDTPGSWSVAPTVVFTGGGGIGAAATAHLSAGGISTISIDNAGSGYTSRPTISFTGGTGSGGSAHSVLTATSVASITLTGSGSFYQNPSVSITGTGGSSATATALLNSTHIQSLTLTAAGSSYVTPVVTITAGGGTGATATATIASGTVTSVTLTNPGSGFTSNPTVTTSGGGGTGAVIVATIGSNTFVEAEPVTASLDIVLRSSIDLTTIPATKTFPVSFRVRKKTVANASIYYITTTEDTAFGMQETTNVGGSGPVLAYMDEMYMTESQYQSYNPSGFSNTGASISYTILAWAISASGFPHISTFRATPIDNGSTAGILDISSEEQRLGIRKVRIIRLTQDY